MISAGRLAENVLHHQERSRVSVIVSDNVSRGLEPYGVDSLGQALCAGAAVAAHLPLIDEGSVDVCVRMLGPESVVEIEALLLNLDSGPLQDGRVKIDSPGALDAESGRGEVVEAHWLTLRTGSQHAMVRSPSVVTPRGLSGSRLFSPGRSCASTACGAGAGSEARKGRVRAATTTSWAAGAEAGTMAIASSSCCGRREAGVIAKIS